jgi:hypothetical protein
MEGNEDIQDPATIETLRSMAKQERLPSELLKHLTVDLEMTDQIDIMRLFSTAMGVTLGEVTAIAAWWHEGERELTDTDIDAYMGPIVREFAKSI